MEILMLLSLVGVLVVTPVSLECTDNNCAKPGPVDAGPFIPFFLGMAGYNGEQDQGHVDDAIFPLEPSTNTSDDSEGIISIRITEVISFGDPSQDQPSGEQRMPLLQKMLYNMFADIGLLDLSGKTMTSSEVYAALRQRNEEGRPVSTLVLSNSRIQPMNSGTFAAAEKTIQTLVMDNSSVNLDALRGLTNLRVLNLSNNALTTFPWYGLMAETLEVLDLSNNKYEEIRSELSMLKNLRELYLSKNKIMDVPVAPLSLLPNLETLDLSMNVILRADLHSLRNLKRLDLDWNYIRLMGYDCILPPQPLSLKLASNPWRCDCGLLEARDSNEILDIDQLQCAMNRNEYRLCVNCPRAFLPDAKGLSVAALTKKSIKHKGCNSIPELYYFLSKEYVKLRDNEPEKLVQDIVLFIILILFSTLIIFVTIRDCCCQSRAGGGKVWLRTREIPKWSCNKQGKSQEIPYIQIDKTSAKA